MNFEELGAMGICIDTYDNGEVSGRVFSAIREKPVEFTSAISLIKVINGLCDEADTPQTTMRCRTFASQTGLGRVHAVDPRRFNYLKIDFRGTVATFSIRVQYRQNSSWQGTLCWIEAEREESFRSVMEFLLLMDSALIGN